MILQKTISADDARKLIQRGEDHFFDHKSKEVSGKKLQKIAVAFANADGGEFIVGIADENNEPDMKKKMARFFADRKF